MKLCIADPPYPPDISERHDTASGIPRLTFRSRSGRYYGDGTRSVKERAADWHPEWQKWDDPQAHWELIDYLDGTFDGWALATSMDGLDWYRPLPVAAEVMIWHNTRAQPTSARVARTLEAVIVVTPVDRRAVKYELGQVPDLLRCAGPKSGFTGAKPEAWTRWVLDAMGHDPETDDVIDLFPGSGAVARATTQGVLL